MSETQVSRLRRFRDHRGHVLTHVITGACITDDSCVSACPVDCIHPTGEEPGFAVAEQLYIDPAACIGCDACVDVCPVDAIYAPGDLPAGLAHAAQVNAEFFAQR